MDLPVHSSAEENFEYDSSSELPDCSAQSSFTSSSYADADDEHDVEPYTLEEGTLFTSSDNLCVTLWCLTLADCVAMPHLNFCGF